MQPIDITSNTLAGLGYTLKIEGSTVLLESTNNGVYPKRFQIYPKDWAKTSKRVEKTLEDASFKQEIIQVVLKDMSDNFQTIISHGKGSSNSTNNNTTSTNAADTIIGGPKMASKAIRAGCSMEEWSKTLQQKYNNLKSITEEKAPGLWLPLEFVLAMKCVLNLKDLKLPVIGIILGPPGSWKTVAVNMPKGARDTIGVDNFSPKSFVSHNTNLSEEELQQIDLLPKIKNKLFMVPELSPLFTSREEDLENIIGMIVRLGDGEGYTSASGTKGTRGYQGPIMFCWAGAAVEIPYKIHTMLSRLGPKLYFFRLPQLVSDEDRLLQTLQEDNFAERMKEIKTAVFDYLEYLESCPEMEMGPQSGIPKFNWNSKDSVQEDAQRLIIKLAELLAYLRGTVATWETKDTQGLEFAYTSRTIEVPERAAFQLYNLARAHALSQGRQRITVKDDLPLSQKLCYLVLHLSKESKFLR